MKPVIFIKSSIRKSWFNKSITNYNVWFQACFKGLYLWKKIKNWHYNTANVDGDICALNGFRLKDRHLRPRVSIIFVQYDLDIDQWPRPKRMDLDSSSACIPCLTRCMKTAGPATYRNVLFKRIFMWCFAKILEHVVFIPKLISV